MSRFGGLRHRQGPRMSMPRATARDGSLSYRHRGVLAYLLSHKDGWIVRAEQIAGDGDGCEGREAIRTVLRDLYRHGYYRQEKRRVVGRFGRRVWESGGSLSEVPVPEWVEQHRRFGGKPVTLLQHDDDPTRFVVRYPDGSLGSEEWIQPVNEQPADSGADPTDVDERGVDDETTTAAAGDGFSGPGPSTGNPQVAPEYGFSGSGCSGPEKPAAGQPESTDTGLLRNPLIKGDHQGLPPGGSSLPTVGTNHQGMTGARGNLRRGPAAATQPPLTSSMPSPAPPARPHHELGYRIARDWLAYRDRKNLPVVVPRGKNAAQMLCSLIEPHLDAGWTEHEVKIALARAGAGIPTRSQFSARLDEQRSPGASSRRTGRGEPTNRYRGGPADVQQAAHNPFRPAAEPARPTRPQGGAA